MEINRKSGCVALLILALTASLAVAEDANPPGPSSAAAPRLDRWRVIGPGGGGAMYLPTVSPHDPKLVLVRCDMGGAYISHDGGASWRLFHLRGTVGFFEFDSCDRNVIYAASIALFRSADRGRTWHMLYPPPGQMDRIEQTGDHAGERIVMKDGSEPRLNAIAQDPATPKRLFLALHEARSGSSILTSPDGGATWTTYARLPEPALKLWFEPGGKKLIAATAKAILVEGTPGVFDARPAPGGIIDASAGFDGPASRLYATSASGIHSSADLGRTWDTTLIGKATLYPAIAASRRHPLTAYASFARSRDTERAFGVAKTTDGGKTWNPVWRDLPGASASNVADAWINARFGPGWGGYPLTIGVSPNDPDLVYTTDFGRTMRSSDGGATWHAVYSRRMSNGAFTSTGLDVTTVYGLHWDPHDSRRMFIDFTDIGLFRSEDGGNTWTPSSEGMPDRWVNTSYWMEFDPEVKGRAWVALSGTHDLPRPKMWRQMPVSRYRGGVAETSDGGKTWQALAAQLPQGAATHILLDRKSPPGARTLYVTMFGRGVYKSTDGGRTWTLKNQGIEGEEPFAWRLTESPRDGALWLVVARRSEDGSAGGPLDGALYRSTDGAEHWTRVPLPEGVNGPNALTVDAEDPQRLYLSLWGRAARPVNRDGGILLSTDGGASWKRLFDRDRNIYDVTQDQRNPNHLYACGFSGSVWRSTDRGAAWQRLRGYNFKWGHRVVMDPVRPDRIFVTTFGGGVWHGPAAGDAKAAEDIVTPVAERR